jgi:hypothetical protein
VRVEVDGPELPVMDGSAAPFVYLIRSAGIYQQREERQMLRIRRKIEVVDGDRSISIEPSREFRVNYAVISTTRDPSPGDRLGPLSPERFERDISAARTFDFLREVRASGTPVSRAAAARQHGRSTREGGEPGRAALVRRVRHRCSICGDLRAARAAGVWPRPRRAAATMHQRLVSATRQPRPG